MFTNLAILGAPPCRLFVNLVGGNSAVASLCLLEQIFPSPSNTFPAKSGYVVSNIGAPDGVTFCSMSSTRTSTESTDCRCHQNYNITQMCHRFSNILLSRKLVRSALANANEMPLDVHKCGRHLSWPGKPGWNILEENMEGVYSGNQLQCGTPLDSQGCF